MSAPTRADAWTCRYCGKSALALGAFGAPARGRYAAFLCNTCGASHALTIPPGAAP